MPLPDPRKQTAARIQRTEAYAKKIQRMFSQTVNDLLALPISKADVSKGNMFSFDAETDRVQRQVEQLLRRLQASATFAVQKGVALEWEEANKAADAIIKSQFSKSALASPYMKGWNARNHDAMQQFINRSDTGMNLSQRIWQSCRQLRDEMEVALTISIGEGEDAGTISRRVRQYLNDPDLMFRRFRYKDEEGRWQLKWKKRIHDPDNPGKYKFIDYDKDSYKDQWTGRGYYKSSAMNAMRVARTETNIAYRRADHERWQDLDFVIGQRVQLSRNHPEVDICDKLAGDYPKDFVFDGWHPQCFCFVTPILMDEEEMAKMNEAFVRRDEYVPRGEQITEYPEGFKDWVKENEPKIRAAQQRGTEPYFIRNNAEVVEGIINPKAKTHPAAKENGIDNAANIESRIKDEISAISSVKNLRDYFTANIADDFNIDVNKKDLEAWKEIALQLRQRMEEFGIPKFSEIGIPSRKNAVASYDGFENAFNLVLSKVKSSWKAEEKWRRKGTIYSAIEDEADVIRATIDHELGHKLYKMYGMKESTIKAFKIAGKSVLGPDGKLFAEINDVLGYYASTNESEYFAEAFTKYMSRNRASLGPETTKLMDEFMAKVNARNSKLQRRIPQRQQP